MTKAEAMRFVIYETLAMIDCIQMKPMNMRNPVVRNVTMTLPPKAP